MGKQTFDELIESSEKELSQFIRANVVLIDRLICAQNHAELIDISFKRGFSKGIEKAIEKIQSELNKKSVE